MADKKENLNAEDPEEGVPLNDTEKKAPEKKKTDRELEKDKRRYTLGICLFLVLNVLLITLIAITAYYVFSEKKVIVLRDADMCVPCEDLRLHPDDKVEGIERRGEDKSTCCVADKEASDTLIGFVIDHWLKKKLVSEERTFTRYKCDEKGKAESQKPILKLVGRKEKQTGEHHRLRWDGDSELAIVPDHTQISHHKEHGLVEIKISGLYQIYSQIVLDHDMSTQDQYNAPAIYQHSVVLIEDGHKFYDKRERETFLLKASNSHCASQSNSQTVTSYLGGAFQLSEGDKLAVKAHNKTELVQIPHMNFFGAHML